MAQKSNEHKLQNEVRNQLAGKVRVFRANVGQGWAANSKDTFKFSRPQAITVSAGDVLLRNARPFNTGLPVGFPDTFGWQDLVITPEMVGQTLALFWALELKDKASLSEEQANFIAALIQSGGKAGAPRSEQEACQILGVEYEPDANRRSRK